MPPPTESRETRERASEIKFLVDPAHAPGIREWARTHLAPDPYGTGEWRDEYAVTTLYLDTGAFDVFHRRASYGRSKYRVRRYGTSPVVFLERKLRTGGLLSKRRSAVPEGDLAGIGTDGVGPRWFRRRLAVRRLRPVCQILYRRMARVAATPYGPARLTLDAGISTQPAGALAFVDGPGTPVASDRVILELKFCVEIPAFFRQLAETFRLSPQAVSKYRMAVSTLGLAPLPEPAGAARAPAIPAPCPTS